MTAGGSVGIAVGRRRRPALVLLLLIAPVIACGVKGPPLPPLMRVPAAPADLTAERRGDHVDIRFVVPAANTDGSRPANIQRVDIYALTGPTNASDVILLRRGTRVASVAVKAPRDPDETVEPGDSISDVDPPEGAGLDQGAMADVRESLSAAARETVDITEKGSNSRGQAPTALVGPMGAPSRTFVGVGITTRGRRGPVSRRSVVTLAPAPPAPAQPDVTYNETSMTVTWKSATAASPAPPAGDLLPSTAFGTGAPATAYHVYDVTPPAAKSASAQATQPKAAATVPETRLTKNPVTDGPLVDTRIEWGVERCYTIRVVQTFGELRVESEPAPPRCVTPADTFPPAVPTGVTPIPSGGTITLIWNPNAEADLAGYIVLRAPAGSAALMPLTPAPIQLTTFRDAVPAGTRFSYAVRAIDKAGNTSADSARVEETAR